MSAAKHTPGPWKADLCLEGWGIHEVQRADGAGIARLAEMQTAFAPDDKEGIANALLIAAAPDLLEALRAARRAMQEAEVAWCDGTPSAPVELLNAISDAQAAIAKATGGAA